MFHFGNAESFYYARGRGELASVEDAARLNMEAALRGITDADMHVWRGTIVPALVTQANKRSHEPGRSFRQEWIRQRAPQMTLDEIGQVRPYGAGNTVLEAVTWLSAAFARVKDGDEPEEVLKMLPTTCESSFAGQACLAYCGGARTCLSLAGRSLREKGIVEVRL